jgi:hypothetical protein
MNSDDACLDASTAAPGRWLVKLPDAARVDRLAELNADLMRNRPRRRRILLAITRLAVTFGIGVAVTLLWQPYGDAARTMIANAAPQLGWLVPPQAAPDAGSTPSLASQSSALQSPASQSPAPMTRSTVASSDLDAVRDRVDQIAISQEQISRTIVQLTASQERIAEEIAKLREVEQYLLYKTSYKGDESAPPRPVTAHRPTRRASR